MARFRKSWCSNASLRSLILVLCALAVVQVYMAVSFFRASSPVSSPVSSPESSPASAIHSFGDTGANCITTDTPPAAMMLQQLSARNISRMRIYVYDMPPRFTQDLLGSSIVGSGASAKQVCRVVFYGNEIALHEQLLDSPWRTTNPDEADLFYVPVYASCLIKMGARTLVPPIDSSFTPGYAPDIPHVSTVLGDALNFIRRMPFWGRKGGEDHIWAFTQGFGPEMFGDELWNQVRHSIFLTNNGQYSEARFIPGKDIVMPGLYSRTPVFVKHPNPTKQVRRSTRVYWGGSVMDDLRYSRGTRHELELLMQDGELPPGVLVSVSRGKWVDIFTPARNAVFCLCLEGWWAWTPRPVEVVMEGCIPVIVSDDLELPFERVLDYSAFSVKFSPSRSMRSILDILIEYPESEVQRLQRGVRQVWREFYYYQPSGRALLNIISMVGHSLHRLNRHRTDRILVSREWKLEWNVPDGVAKELYDPDQFNPMYSKALDPNLLHSMKHTVAQQRLHLQHRPEESSSWYVAQQLNTCTAWEQRLLRPLTTKEQSQQANVAVNQKRSHCWNEGAAPEAWKHCPSRDFGASFDRHRRPSVLVRVDLGSYTYSLLVQPDFCRDVPGSQSSGDSCQRRLRVHTTASFVVSLAVQSDVSRLSYVVRMLRAFQGPVSWAVFVVEESQITMLNLELAMLSEHERALLTVHLVQPVGVHNLHPLAVYPINVLRAVAQQMARTEFVLVLDADIMLSSTHDQLLTHLDAAMRLSEKVAAVDRATPSSRSNVGGDANVAAQFEQCDDLFAYVIPSFEPAQDSMTIDQATKLMANVHQVGAERAVERGLIWPMHMYYSPAYGPIDYPRWLRTKLAYQVTYSERFEPYLVIPRTAPLPDTRFVDRGGNYAQWVYTLWASGYQMWALPEVFALDVPTGAGGQLIDSPQSADLWTDMQTRLLKQYGVIARSPVKKYGELKRALRTSMKLASSVDEDVSPVTTEATRWKKINQWAQFNASSSISGQLTLLTMTYKRDALMRYMVRHYCKMPEVSQVIVVSNNIDRRPYPESWFGCPIPVRMVIARRNSMNNRFDPKITGPIPTQGVLLMDDDIIFPRESVRLALRTWQNSPQQHVGFMPRYVHTSKKTGEWVYGVGEVATCQCYNMVLVGASIFHRSWLQRYQVSNQQVRRLVDDKTNCDDIAFSFMVAAATQLPPIWVRSTWFRTSTKSGLESRSTHKLERRECAEKFAEWTKGRLVLNRAVVSAVRPESVIWSTPMTLDFPDDIEPGHLESAATGDSVDSTKSTVSTDSVKPAATDSLPKSQLGQVVNSRLHHRRAQKYFQQPYRSDSSGSMMDAPQSLAASCSGECKLPNSKLRSERFIQPTVSSHNELSGRWLSMGLSLLMTVSFTIASFIVLLVPCLFFMMKAFHLEIVDLPFYHLMVRMVYRRVEKVSSQ